MTTKFALILAGLIAAGLIADQFLWEGTYLLFLSKKLVDLINYIAFWR